MFRYEFDFVSNRFSTANNPARQAGTAYALGTYAKGIGRIDVATALARAIRAFDGYSKPYRNGKLFGLNDYYFSGATALALLSELLYFEVTCDPQYEASRIAWRDGLLGLRRQDKGFRRSPDTDAESPYGNGEAWLALGRYAALFPQDTQVADHLTSLDAYFLNEYDDARTVAFFHWAVLAAVERYRSTSDEALRDFVAGLTRAYILEARPRTIPDYNTCYALEGLIPAYAVLKTKPDVASALLETLAQRIDSEMHKNLRFQITPGMDVWHLYPGGRLYSKSFSDFSGAFLNGRRRPQTRIDFTQHCLSAMIAFHQLSAD